ncbi:MULTISPECIES: cyclic nucleotide-gated ion channel [unclassified Xanthobacter]|uniref:cyclic nucleotide-gated ion channel n=1 Tax=unclassified Xanthobacter TaxID=2623496 RepID=UPI001F4309D7|nr:MULTISPECIES: cyclic nucleotide-gated ion channel [unclassified Xanthobacter]
MSLEQIRQRTFDILERDMPGDVAADVVHFFLILLVLVSVVGAVLGTVPSFELHEKWWFNFGEFCALIVFSIEYLVRIWVAPEHPLRRQLPAWRARLNYLATPAAIIDLLAVAPVLVAEFAPMDTQALLVLRLLRFLKLARYSSGFNALYLAVKRERYALLACLVLLWTGVLLAATAMYLVERNVQPDKFGSIPESMWWAITTLTTVGYGDTVPITTIGRMIGAVTMVTGLIMLALPIAIVASSFSDVISKHNFVVTFSMLSRLPPFSDLDARVLGDLLPLFNSRSFDRGRQVVRPGERARHLFVVLEGELESTGGERTVRLGAGDVFGISPGTDGSAQPVRALTKSKLLAIEEEELNMLTLRYPDISRRLTEMAGRPTGGIFARRPRRLVPHPRKRPTS